MISSVELIDFLPDGYHKRRLHRRSNGWRWVIAAAFAGLIAVGVVGNRMQHARLIAERDQYRPQADLVTSAEQELAALSEETRKLTARADLRAGLRLQPSPTRILAALTEALPPGTALVEVEWEAANDQPSPARPASETESLLPPEQDLAHLSGQSGHYRIEVQGLAPDDAAVSEYLAGLDQSALFQRTKLQFTDHHTHLGHDLRKFSVTLDLLPALPKPIAAADASVPR